MLGKLGRRAIDAGVLFLALYAFAFVPLGERTGLEHLRAILETRAAKDAGEELLGAVERLKRRLLGSDEAVHGRGEPRVPKLPKRRDSTPNAAITQAPAHDGPDASQ